MKKTSKWWWISENHNTSNSSTWLNSTLSELDAKTKEMLKVIDDEVDDEADSFAKRAEMYYEKRPKLIAMVEDLYRSHRSLAQKHDLLIKTRHNNNNSSTCDESWSELCEDTESEVVDYKSDENKVVEFGYDGGEAMEKMKEELERLREESRVYKELMMRENRQVNLLFTNSIIRICFGVFLLPFQLLFLLFSPLAFLFTIFLEFYLKLGAFCMIYNMK